MSYCRKCRKRFKTPRGLRVHRTTSILHNQTVGYPTYAWLPQYRPKAVR